ncbi:MAG: hypothetical protein HUK08_01135 [Bacteroidaceae bacterium]|nr:hypothetical protein [Bacteroidaceae bacterium]
MFVRTRTRVDWQMINHESIHSAQIKELFYLPFYAIYLAEWMFRFFFTKHRFSKNAYLNMSFEREAFAHETQRNYLKKRKHFAQWRSMIIVNNEK